MSKEAVHGTCGDGGRGGDGPMAVVHRGPSMATSGSRSLLEIGLAKEKPLVLSDPLKWLIEPLGQVWQGYVYLVAGQPGSRKSGLTLQVALDLAQRGQKVLFILTEEPASRLLERALRMMSAWPQERVRRTLATLLVEEILAALDALPRFLGSNVLADGGRFHGVSLIVLD